MELYICPECDQEFLLPSSYVEHRADEILKQRMSVKGWWKQETAQCPFCKKYFVAPAGHDPLKFHIDYCIKRHMQ